MSQRDTTSRLSRRDGGREAAGVSTTLRELLDDGSDRRFRVLIHDLFGLAARLERVREQFAAMAGVSGPQYSMMILIARLVGDRRGVTVGQLAEHLHVSGTFVTAESKKLETAGYLERVPNPADRRSVLLGLTASGQALMHDLLPAVRAVNDELFRGMGRGEFEIVSREVAGLVESCGDALLVAESYRRKWERTGAP
jgi:MarR family transcriptional regulator, organic hydroperoxide resistance regulator